MQNFGKIKGRFPADAELNRYPSKARVSLKDYVAEVGKIIENHPHSALPGLVNEICEMPNVADKAEALAATSFHLKKLGEKEREKVLDHSIDILRADFQTSRHWHRSTQPNAVKAIYHGADSLTESQHAQLTKTYTRDPKVRNMMESYFDRRINFHLDAVLEKGRPVSINALSVSEETGKNSNSSTNLSPDPNTQARADLMRRPRAVLSR